MIFNENTTAWTHYFYDVADPRTQRDRFLMGSPVQIVCLSILYIYVSNYALEGLMRNRKPVNIRFASIVYNIYLWTGYIVITYKLGYLRIMKYNWRNEPVNRSYSKEASVLIES
jgi:hypothetical protein